MAGGDVPTRMRALLDVDPGGLKPSCAGGQRRFDPGRWDAAEGQSPIKSIPPPGRERGQEFRSHTPSEATDPEFL